MKNNVIYENELVKNIIIINPVAPELLKNKTLKVCVYARVSTENIEQQNSYLSQINTYSKLINENPQYEFVGVYADDGVSGKNTDNRRELNRLIEHCHKGKIDRIITKSISRFARNTYETISIERELKKIGVTILFEQENIDTSTMENEFAFSMLAMLAEHESKSTSQNIRQGIVQRMKNGTFKQSTLPFGYEYDNNKQLVIIESQAVIIKKLFDYYLQGNGTDEVTKILNQNYPDKKWNRGSVFRILQNEFYTGDCLWHKTYRDGQSQLKNIDTYDKYFIINHHDGIINHDDFNKVQKLISTRTIKHKMTKDVFAKKLKCSCCNMSIKRKSNSKGKVNRVCRTRNLSSANCRSPIVEENKLITTIYSALGKLSDKYNLYFTKLINSISKINATSQNTEITEIYNKISSLHEQGIIYTEFKLEGSIPEDIYQAEMSKIKYEIKYLTDQKNKLYSQNTVFDRLDEIRELQSFFNFTVDIYSIKLEEILNIIKCVYINLDETITIQFIGDIKITVSIESE